MKKNHILFKIIFIFIPFITFSQVVVTPSFTVSQSNADSRALGWAGGQTYTYASTSGAYPGCTYWGIQIPTGASCDAHINMNNATGPGTSCVFDTGSDLPTYTSGLGTATLVISGTTSVYVHNGSTWTTLTNVDSRATLTVTGATGTWTSNGTNYLIKVAGSTSFNVNVLFEAYGPNGASYYQTTNSSNQWTPAITLYDRLKTNSARSICTTFDPVFFAYTQVTANAITGGTTPVCSGTSAGTITANPVNGSGDYTVEFFKNGVSVGTDATAPYTFDILNTLIGNDLSFDFHYVVTDNCSAYSGYNASATSAIKNFKTYAYSTSFPAITTPASCGGYATTNPFLFIWSGPIIGQTSKHPNTQYRVRLNGGSWVNKASTISHSFTLITGLNTFEVQYVDGCSGNSYTSTCEIYLPAGPSVCNEIYVDNATGNDSYTGSPYGPFKTIGAAIAAASSGTHIKVANGNYSQASPVNLKSDIIIEGGYTNTSGNWVKSSVSSTNVSCSGFESINTTVEHWIGFKSVSANNWIIADLNISTTNATGTTSTGFGRSNYAVYISNSTGFKFVRSTLNSGTATNGSNGSNGSNGGAGNKGGTGGTGQSTCYNFPVDFGDDDGGGGGGGATPGSGGANASGIGGNGGNGYNGGNGGNGKSDYGGGNQGSAGAQGAGAGGAGGALGSDDSGNNDTPYGSNGSAGSVGTAGSNGSTQAASYSSNFYNPSYGTNGTSGTGGTGGGGGGGGGKDTGGGCASSGGGGSGGGGGGGGGGAGSGGKGGGSSFALFLVSVSGESYTNSVFNSGSFGTGGTSGLGGAGGAGGAGGDRSNTTSDGQSNRGGLGGAGGSGGAGGAGGAGGDGFSAAVYKLGTGAYNPSNAIPTSPNVTLSHQNNYKSCTNSEMQVNKASGTWTLGTGLSFVNDLTSTTSSYDVNSSSALVYSNSTGLLDIGASGANLDDFVIIKDSRSLPTINTINDLCIDGDITISTPSSGTEYDWQMKVKPAGFTNFTSSTVQNPGTITMDVAGTYELMLRVKDECCGWSIPVWETFIVHDKPSVSLTFTDDIACVTETNINLNAISSITVSPTGGSGVWSGTAVTGNTFNPNTAGVASGANQAHSITYTYTDLNTCQNSGSADLTVFNFPTAGTTSSDQVLCINENAANVTLSGNNAGVASWEIDNNAAFSSPATISSTSTTLNGTDIDSEIGAINNILLYVRAVVDNSACPTQNSTAVTVRYNQPDVVTTTASASGTCASNGTNTWVNIFDNNGNIIASVDDDGLNMGNVTVSVPSVGNASPSDVCGSGLNAYMGRYFSFSSSNTGWYGNDIRVRLYFTAAELSSLITEAGCADANGCADNDDVCGIADIVATKYATGAGPGGSGTFLTQFTNGYSSLYAANYVDFKVSSFSDIYLHGSETGVALPVELISFTAKAVNNQFIQLNWSTATEINNEGFAVERSTDGVNFIKIGYISGNGNSNMTNHYSYQDSNVSEGIYYYRLKQIDYDGASEYSPIRNASITGRNQMVLSQFIPNPADQESYLNFIMTTNAEVSIIIVDELGRKVSERKQKLTEGNQSMIFNTQNLAAGIYTAKIRIQDEEYTRKLVIKK